MDLLTPILAYLGTVTAMIAGVAMAYDAFIYKPLHPPNEPSVVAMLAMQRNAKLAISPTAKTAHTVPPRSPPALAAVRRPERLADRQRTVHRSRKIARWRHRRWPEQEARSRLREYPPPRFERDAFGYARGPFGSGDDWFQ